MQNKINRHRVKHSVSNQSFSNIFFGVPYSFLNVTVHKIIEIKIIVIQNTKTVFKYPWRLKLTEF